MKLTGPTSDGWFCIQLQPENPNPQAVYEGFCVLEICFILLDDRDDWIGVQIPPLKEELKELALSESTEKSISETMELYWTENKNAAKKLEKEMEIDVDQNGIWKIEIQLGEKNKNISFKSFNECKNKENP